MKVRCLRRGVTVAWIAAVMACLGVVAFARLTDAVVITGGSMQPAIGRGSLVILDSTTTAPLQTGDVVTVHGPGGLLITHRIARVVELAAGRHLELRGDANPRPDAVLVPVTAVIGRVDAVVPHLGYLTALLSMPLGLVSVLALLGAGILAIWFLEDVEAERRHSGRSGLQHEPAA